MRDVHVVGEMAVPEDAFHFSLDRFHVEWNFVAELQTFVSQPFGLLVVVNKAQ